MLAKIQPVVVLTSPLPFPYDSLCLETLKILEDKVKQTNIFDMKEQANNVNDEFDDRNQCFKTRPSRLGLGPSQPSRPSAESNRPLNRLG